MDAMRMKRPRPRWRARLSVLLLVVLVLGVQCLRDGRVSVATANTVEVTAARLLGFDQVEGKNLRILVDAGFCADDLDPKPTIDRLKIVERGKSAMWPDGYVLITAFTRREVVPEEGPTCKPFGFTLTKSVKLRRPAAGLPILDGSRQPPQRISSLEPGRPSGPSTTASG